MDKRWSVTATFELDSYVVKHDLLSREAAEEEVKALEQEEHWNEEGTQKELWVFTIMEYEKLSINI